MPFLAHSLGTFGGAFVAALIAPDHKMKFAIAMGALGLAGGITAVSLFGGPVWFIVLDLVVAYLPFAFVGGKLASGFGAGSESNSKLA